jgi:hypothetical protein
MYIEFDEEVFLAPETLVSLAAAGHDEERVFECEDAAAAGDAWARHAQRSDGFGAAVLSTGDDNEPPSLQDAIRHALELDWY